VLNPSQTLLITSADKNREGKNKGKGGKKRHAASPKRLLTEGAEPIVPLSLSLFFLLFFYFVFSLLYFFCFLCFFRGQRTGATAVERTDRDGGPRR
jgi:hypothetical protein